MAGPSEFKARERACHSLSPAGEKIASKMRCKIALHRFQKGCNECQSLPLSDTRRMCMSLVGSE
jgi:hypothetical protein